MAVSFVLNNAEFPPLSTVSTVTPFSKTYLPISKNFAPEDKPVLQLLRNTSCKSEFVPIKRNTVNHVLCKYFLSRDSISVVSQIDVVNVNVKFTPLLSRVHVVKSHSRPLHVCLKSTNNFHHKHSISSKCLQRSLTHQSNTSCQF